MVTVDPALLTDAATDLTNIRTSLEDAVAVAETPTVTITPPGADEVSVAISGLLGNHGAQFQQLAAQATRFHDQFAQNLMQAATAYTDTEQAAGQTLRGDITAAEQLVVGVNNPVQPPIGTNVNPIGLVVGGTGQPVLAPGDLANLQSIYHFPNPYALLTPEQFFPGTPALGALTLNQSVAQGQTLLNNAIMAQLAAGHTVTVFGLSQGATVETAEIRHLMSIGSPGSGQLSFILAGDPNNPNGGFFTRFPGLHIGFLGISASPATPPNSPYPTTIYSNQYDGVSQFPQYPLNIVSDANALAGFLFGQHFYTNQVTGAIQLPTSPGYSGNTTYFLTLDQTVPLIEPLHGTGTYGTALADLLQPDLRVIVDMGYTSGYGDIVTGATLSEHPDWPVIIGDLRIGAVQGVDAAGVDLNLLPRSDFPTTYPFTPELNPGLNNA